MKITIIYDNTAYRNDLTTDWGFSCLVEAHGSLSALPTVLSIKQRSKTSFPINILKGVPGKLSKSEM